MGKDSLFQASGILGIGFLELRMDAWVAGCEYLGDALPLEGEVGGGVVCGLCSIA